MRTMRITLRLLQLTMLVAAVTLVPAAAEAVLVTPTNYDGVSWGHQYFDEVATMRVLATPDGIRLGTVDISRRVIWDNCPSGSRSCAGGPGLHTLIYRVSPTVATGMELIVGHSSGFNGVAGYSFSQAATAGDANPFTIDADPSGKIHFTTTDSALAGSFWDAAQLTPITFFYQTRSPLDYNTVSFITTIGTASAYHPASVPAAVPEPGSLLLLGSGALARWMDPSEGARFATGRVSRARRAGTYSRPSARGRLGGRRG
jgi:hypothetical protein